MFFQGEPNKIMGNTTKGIRQIKEGKVECPSLDPGILDCFAHDNVMFEATRNAREERFLHFRIDNIIAQ